MEQPFLQLRSGLRCWLLPSDVTSAARRSAWLVAIIAALLLWVTASIHAGAVLAAQVRTPTFLLALILGMIGAITLGLVLTAPLLAVPLGWLLERLVRRWPALRRWATPPVVLTASGLLALASVVLAGWRYRQIAVHLPWGLAAGAAGGLILARGAAHLALSRFGARRTAIILLATILPYFWAGRSPRVPRLNFMVTPSLTAACQHLFGSPAEALAEADGGGENPDTGRYSEGALSQALPAGVHTRPHIVLVTTDSLSFAHTTLGGYRRDTTPRLAAWAMGATSFPTAFSLSAATRTAFPGLLAGVFNAQAALKPGRVPPYSYTEDMPTLAALLRSLGYRTVHIPGDRFFLQGGLGWHTVGFDLVDQACTKASDPIHTAPEITEAAIRHIDDQPPDQPLFLWVHYFDHHIPFQLAAGVDPFDSGREPEDLYDAELRYADRHWGRLLQHVERTWPAGRHLTVFTADHGESFDANHPDKHHSGSILTSVLRVPLVIQTSERRGQSVQGLVSHADILPTIANIVGLPPRDAWVGSSLVSVLFAGAAVERTVQYALRFAPELYRSKGGGFLEIGVRTRDHYLIHDLVQGTSRMVDWRNDLLEEHDLSGQYSEEYARLRALARKKLAWLKARECGLRYPDCPGHAPLHLADP